MDEVTEILGEIVRVENELSDLMEAQVKPRRQVLKELNERLREAYGERDQMKMDLR